MRLELTTLSRQAIACAVGCAFVISGAQAQQPSQPSQQDQGSQRYEQQDWSEQQGRNDDTRTPSNRANEQSTQQSRDQGRLQTDTPDTRRFQTDQLDRQSTLQREGVDQYGRTDRYDSQRDRTGMQRDQQRGTSPPAGLGVSVVDGNRGVRVQRVAPDSPAQSAGIRVGDEILAVNGRQIRDGEQLVYVVQEEDPGASVDIELFRNGRIELVSADLEHRGEIFGNAPVQQRRFGSDYSAAPPWDDDELRRHIESLEQTVDQMQREIRDLRAMLDNDPSGRSYSSSPMQRDQREMSSHSQGVRSEFQRTEVRQYDQQPSQNTSRAQLGDRNRLQNDGQNRSQRDRENFDRDNFDRDFSRDDR